MCNKKVVLITGASSGFGLSAAKMYAKEGYRVYAAARRLEKMNQLKAFGVKVLKMDVTDDAQVKDGVSSVIKNEGRIDILINSAGYGGYGTIECVSMEEAHNQMEVNVFGTIRVIKAVLPYMRQMGEGRIINLSSVIGRSFYPVMGWYGASKHAIESLSDTLRLEVASFGIDVIIVEPAPVRTGFLGVGKKQITTVAHNKVYKGNVKRFMRRFSWLYKIAPGPDKVAKILLKAGICDKPKRRYPVGLSGKLIVTTRFMPRAVYDRIVKLVFGVR